MAEARKILAVALERESFSELRPMLSRAQLEVFRVSRGKAAFELSDQTVFDLILVGHPLPDIKGDDFFAILQRPESASRASDVLVISEEAEADDLEEFRAASDSRVISLGGPMIAVLQQVASHLGLAQRLSRRVLARLEVQLEERVETRVCQSENISATGMLVKSDRLYPVGTHLTVTFDLPTDGRPFRSGAEVVRHAEPEREGSRGLGLRFTEAALGDLRRLETYLKSLLAEAE